MDTNARLRGVLCGPEMESLEAVPSVAALFNSAGAVARSEKNILQWMDYLPEDCINRMIEMGWDVTT